MGIRKYITLGMDKRGEVYALELNDDGKIRMNPHGYSTSCVVIRPMSKHLLEEYQTDPEYYRDQWVEAVNGGHTDESLADFVESLRADCYGDEDFPCKDNSFVDDIVGDGEGQVERETLDADAEELTGEPVGTWEASGCFPPDEPFVKEYAPRNIIAVYYKHLDKTYKNFTRHPKD